MTSFTPEAAERRGRPRDPRILLLISAVALVGSAAGLGFLLALRGGRVPGLDTEWMTELAVHRTGPITGVALVFDWIGGGIVGTFVVPLLVLAGLLLARRFWGALFWIVSAALSAGVVELIKSAVDRARPTNMLVVSDPGSFPSGHTANAAVVAVVLAVVLWRWWVTVLGAAWTLAMALSRTYLGAHWLTDTVGGMLVGAGAALLVWGILGSRIERHAGRGSGPPARGRSDSVGT